MNNISELAGKDLNGFKVIEMTEVYRMDVDGRKTASLGFFKDPNIAGAFAGAQKDANYHKTHTVFVLTNGEVGYVIETQESVKLFDDEKEAVDLRKKAIEKLSPNERKLLGFE